jgi:23S rRNA pseudouridine955/2504/2580 synthase/23S rRNA pseudouridine1911/1915/1917 synthase
VAIAAAAPSPSEGTWDAPLGRAHDPRHRAVNGREAAPAKTHYAVAARAGAYALLALAPITGRTHQLRVHASHAAAPLLGDRAYGGPKSLTLDSGRVVALDRIALHCARVVIDGEGPGGAHIALVSSVPDALAAMWVALGGAAEAWEKAASWQLPVD